MTAEKNTGQSWCLATYVTADAITRLQSAVSTGSSGETLASADDGTDVATPSLPPSLIVKLADVPGEIFARKLGNIHSVRQTGRKFDSGGEVGLLATMAATHKEKLELHAEGQKVEFQLSPRPPGLLGNSQTQQAQSSGKQKQQQQAQQLRLLPHTKQQVGSMWSP